MPKNQRFFTLSEVQRLVSNGDAWHKEEWLSRYAAALIAAGQIRDPR